MLLGKMERIFNKLLDESLIGGLETRDDTSLARQTFYRGIWIVEVNKVLAKMKRVKKAIW